MDSMPTKPTKERRWKQNDMMDNATVNKYSQHTESTDLTVALTDSLRTYIEDPSLAKKEDMQQALDQCQEQLSALNSKIEKLEVAAETSPTVGKNRKRLKEKKHPEEDETSSNVDSQTQVQQPLHHQSSHSVRPASNRGQNMVNAMKHQRSSFCSSKNSATDDSASVASKSLASVSQSVRSLPREIELMDEDDNNDNYSFFDDSIESRSSYSQGSRRSHKSRRSLRRNSVRPPAGDDDRDNISVGSARSQTSRRSRGRRRGGDVLRQPSFNAPPIETIFVEKQEISDRSGEECVYTGALNKSNGMPHGKGVLEYLDDSRRCEGDWVNGQLTGYGKVSNGDGDTYEGGMKNDLFHGKGIMRFDNGRVFKGTYIRGEMVQGQMTYNDGSCYEGSWYKCSRHGHGICVFMDGSVYEGEFRLGNCHGKGKMTWTDGGYYEGDWVEGEMHGMGMEIRPNGTLRHNGEWSQGQPVRVKKEQTANKES